MGDPTGASGQFDSALGGDVRDSADNPSDAEASDDLDVPVQPRIDSAGERDPEVERFARRWLRGLTGCRCLRMPHDEAAELLQALSARLASAARGPRPDLAAAAAVGRSLTDVRFDPAEVLTHTVVCVVEGFA